MDTRTILNKQDHVQVVLNGGKFELDDATIPFCIAFDSSIADNEPTHILVLDVMNSPFADEDTNRRNENMDKTSERRMYKLEPLNFLQFTRPGVHHLIFILLREFDGDRKKHYLEKDGYGSIYKNEIWYTNIESGYYAGYAETVVEVPSQFFATKPESGIQKAIWSWSNRWFDSAPIDECAMRKRMIFAFTAQPIMWFAGFLARLVTLVPLLFGFVLIARVLAFPFGIQPRSFFPNRKKILQFLFTYNYTYSEVGYKDMWSVDTWMGDAGKWVLNAADDIDFYSYKTIAIGKKRIHMPVTFSGMLMWPIAVYFYFATMHKYFRTDGALASLGHFGTNFVISIGCALVFTFLTITTSGIGAEWRSDDEEDRNKLKLIFAKIFGGMLAISLTALIVAKVSGEMIWNITKGVTVIAVGFATVFVIVRLAMKFRVVQRSVSFIGTCLLKLASFIGRAFYKLVDMIDKIPAPQWLVKFFDKPVVEPKKEEEKEEKPEPVNKYRKWLDSSFDLSKLPKKVDYNHVPGSETVMKTVVQQFKVSFWRAKQKVCKPFPKQ